MISAVVIADNLPSPAHSAQNLDSIVAVVNNGVITQNELDTAVAHAKAQIVASNNPQAIDTAKLQQTVLQQLIDEKLELEIAKRANVKVSNEKLTQAIQMIAKQNHLTLSQLKSKLQEQGIAYKSYQAEIRKQMLVHQVQEGAVAGKVQVTNQDIQNFKTKYAAQLQGQQQYQVIDVLIPLPSQASAAVIQTAQNQANQIEARWKSGQKPQQFAPNDTQNLGWQSANDLPALFLNQIKAMKTGDISTPIQAPNGFHVIQLAAVRGNAQTDEQLRQMVTQEKVQEAVQKWLIELRKTSYIKITNE